MQVDNTFFKNYFQYNYQRKKLHFCKTLVRPYPRYLLVNIVYGHIGQFVWLSTGRTLTIRPQIQKRLVHYILQISNL